MKKFTREFKFSVAKATGKQSDIARRFGVDTKVVNRWAVEYRHHGEAAFPGKGKPRRLAIPGKVVELSPGLPPYMIRPMSELKILTDLIKYFAEHQ